MGQASDEQAASWGRLLGGCPKNALLPCSGRSSLPRWAAEGLPYWLVVSGQMPSAYYLVIAGGVLATFFNAGIVVAGVEVFHQALKLSN